MKNKILIDTNALILLLIGLMNPKLIPKHKRTSIYEEDDFHQLVSVIGHLEQLVVLPNVWTEVDNLLNSFSNELKYQYIIRIKALIQTTSEQYLESIKGIENGAFLDLGLTDSLLLLYAKNCQLLITSDSRLSDYAIANNIRVFDVIKNRNDRL